MKLPALVAVAAGPQDFADLFDAARAASLRVGWLDLAPEPAVAAPADLDRAAALGALRAVAVGPGRAMTVKPVAGPPVLRDLLREHFLGCSLVLVRGLEGWPRLERAEGGYQFHTGPERAVRRDAAGLLAELRRPRHGKAIAGR